MGFTLLKGWFACAVNVRIDRETNSCMYSSGLLKKGFYPSCSDVLIGEPYLSGVAGVGSIEIHLPMSHGGDPTEWPDDVILNRYSYLWYPGSTATRC